LNGFAPNLTQTENEVAKLVSFAKFISRKIQDGGGRHIEIHISGLNWAISAYICTEFNTEAMNQVLQPDLLHKLQKSKMAVTKTRLNQYFVKQNHLAEICTLAIPSSLTLSLRQFSLLVLFVSPSFHLSSYNIVTLYLYVFFPLLRSSSPLLFLLTFIYILVSMR